MNDIRRRTVFFVSDGTGITAETLGHSLLAQFPEAKFRQVRAPFVDDIDKAIEALRISGAAKAAKRGAERTTANGLVASQDNVMVELLCETDLVAKSEDFQALAGTIVQTAAQLQVGDHLRISPPANLFPLQGQARLHILIAGGIGITPLLAYCAELLRRGAQFELHYAFRAGLSDAYVDSLSELIGARLHCYDSSQRRLDLGQLLRDRQLGSHVYACGPQRLLLDLREQATALGWRDKRVHWEAFAAPEPGLAFRVELVRSGRQLEVPAEQSLLEALEGAGLEIPNLCRGGVCGQCQTRYLKGDVEHRDHYLAPHERADSLMPCVSRGCGSPILLDL